MSGGRGGGKGGKGGERRNEEDHIIKTLSCKLAYLGMGGGVNKQK